MELTAREVEQIQIFWLPVYIVLAAGLTLTIMAAVSVWRVLR